MEMDDAPYAALQRKYRANARVRTLRAEVTPDSVEDLFARGAVPEEPDVVSIDVDGPDYWIWRALRRFRPRVVVVEYNSALDPATQARPARGRSRWMERHGPLWRVARGARRAGRGEGLPARPHRARGGQRLLRARRPRRGAAAPGGNSRARPQPLPRRARPPPRPRRARLRGPRRVRGRRGGRLRLRRDSAIPLGLAAGAFILAILQRPGLATSDTKIDLHVSPGRFLADVASVWTPSGSLGHVQGGQYGGYLFPMGPFFAGLHAIGVSPWLIDRLWLGLLLALSAWGVVRLMDAVLQDRYGSRRGVAHLAAGAIFVLNPYVVVFANRTSVTLLGYAALPWLLLAVHRGVRTPGRWCWPAAFALLVTATGGGVNAAVTGWSCSGRCCCSSTSSGSCASRGERPRLRLARRGGHAGRLAVVDRPHFRAVPVRDRLPQVHRAAGHHLGDHEPAGEPAARWGTGSPTSTSASPARRGCSSTTPTSSCSPSRWSPPRCSCRRWRSRASAGPGVGATGRSSWRCACSDSC